MTKAKLSNEAWNEEAARFHGICGKHGFHWERSGDSVIRISRRFAPNDNLGFTECDMLGPSVIGYVPAKGGSIWGTDGGSVGGHSALIHGHYTLNISGVKKSFMNALMRLYNR